MLLQNGNMWAFTGLRYFGSSGAATGNFPPSAPANSILVGARRNIFAGDAGIDPKSSTPEGCRHPVAWMMPQKAGGLSSRNNLVGTGSVTTTILAVKLAEASLTGDGTLTAFGGLVVQLLAGITGSGGITDAAVQAFLLAVADLTGSGGASGPATGLAAMLAAIVASGTAGGSTATGLGELDADITVTGSGLSTANVGQAVWAAIAAQNNVAGTMGEKLNDAGSGSNPWTEVIESGLTAAEIMRIILAVQAGQSDVSGSTVTFRDQADTKDRVTATMSGSERTSVVVDGS